MLRADRRIVEACRDGVGEFDLAVGIGQEPGLGSLKDAEAATLESGGMFASDDATPSCLDAGHADLFVLKEGMEEADRIAASADAGEQ